MIDDLSESPTHMVVYCDGGCRPSSRGYAAFGYHGYLHRDVPATKGSGHPDYSPGQFEYQIKSDGYGVRPIAYLDAFATIPDFIGTNNIAEIQAATSAMALGVRLAARGLKYLSIWTDSMLVVGACNGRLERLSQNNWIKPDMTRVKNEADLRSLLEAMRSLTAAGVEWTVKWIKGHNGHAGNESADRLATIGTMASMRLIPRNALRLSPPDGYWRAEVEKSPLMAMTKMIFFVSDIFDPGHYGLMEVEQAGLKETDAAYSWVELNNPDYSFEQIRKYQNELGKDSMALMECDLGNLHRAGVGESIYQALQRYGTDCLYQPRLFNAGISFIDKTEITNEKKPALLAFRAADHVCNLRDLLNAYVKNDYSSCKVGELAITDLTETFFSPNKKGELKLKTTFGSGITFVDVQANLQTMPTGEQLISTIRLFFGRDVMNRNNLKRVEDLHPTVKLFVWKESEYCYRFGTMVFCDDGKLIQMSVHSNTKYLPYVHAQ